ncbi:hypothetical protein QCN29_15045 [Streptomyces sp. HNM0663]|uniref:Uncharacterized protein n=1 Tax=Streptomyces chengmaiensis TaxID=3040919 RepID=A0ABT6HPX0_9ACTN|nr:hypothetical protein [Streptomyces chengmaiensis]MDH2390084.1 hypothetical protein [Streptomyces chengmaiensis]
MSQKFAYDAKLDCVLRVIAFNREEAGEKIHAIVEGETETGAKWDDGVELTTGSVNEMADYFETEIIREPDCRDDECRDKKCTESTENGEGWDGYCGHHADVIYAHEEGEHANTPHDDCPDCTTA